MDFLQSEQWRKFQEAAGRRTFLIEDESPASTRGDASSTRGGFHASIIEHCLPAVGKYFYIPRGPILSQGEEITNSKTQISNKNQITNSNIQKLVNLAKKEKAGWIRIDINLKNSNYKIVKAPHDVQPKEVFVIDITKSEEELLAEMKSKTRYNIKLAQKHNVSVKVISNFKNQISNEIQNSNDKKFKYYLDEFIKLVKITAERDKITPHPEEYYRQMFEIIPEDNIKLYVAEYEEPASTRGDASSTRGGKVIAVNTVIFYEDTVTYLHGASDNEYRNVMAPYLLQWQQILDAKKSGCIKYDFGGIKTGDNSSWSGITKFKIGFSPNTKPIEFSGSYDIIINPMKYYLYRIIQKIKSFS